MKKFLGYAAIITVFTIYTGLVIDYWFGAFLTWVFGVGMMAFFFVLDAVQYRAEDRRIKKFLAESTSPKTQKRKS